MSPHIVLVMPRNHLGHESAPGIAPSWLNIQGHLVLGAVGGEGKELRHRSTAVLCPSGTKNSPYPVVSISISNSSVTSEITKQMSGLLHSNCRLDNRAALNYLGLLPLAPMKFPQLSLDYPGYPQKSCFQNPKPPNLSKNNCSHFLLGLILPMHAGVQLVNTNRQAVLKQKGKPGSH